MIKEICNKLNKLALVMVKIEILKGVNLRKMEDIMSHLDKYNLKIISRGKVSELKSGDVKEVEFIINHWFPAEVSLTPPTSQSSRFLAMSESICAWHNWIESKDAINILQCKDWASTQTLSNT